MGRRRNWTPGRFLWDQLLSEVKAPSQWVWMRAASPFHLPDAEGGVYLQWATPSQLQKLNVLLELISGDSQQWPWVVDSFPFCNEERDSLRLWLEAAPEMQRFSCTWRGKHLRKSPLCLQEGTELFQKPGVRQSSEALVPGPRGGFFPGSVMQISLNRRVDRLFIPAKKNREGEIIPFTFGL